MLPYNQSAHVSAASVYSIVGGLVAPAAFQALYTEKFAAAADDRCVSIFRGFAAVAFLMAIVTVLVSAMVVTMLLSLRTPYKLYQHESLDWLKLFDAYWRVMYSCMAACMLCFVAMYFVGCVCFFGTTEAGRAYREADTALHGASNTWANTGLINNNGGAIRLPVLNNSGVIYNSGNISVPVITAAAPSMHQAAQQPVLHNAAAAMTTQALLFIIGIVGMLTIVIVIITGYWAVVSEQSSRGGYEVQGHVIAYELWNACRSTHPLANVVVDTRTLLRQCQAAFQLHSNDGPLPLAFIQLSQLEEFIHTFMLSCSVDKQQHTVTILAHDRADFVREATQRMNAGDWQA